MNNILKAMVLVLMAGVSAACAQGLYQYNWTYSSSLYTGAGTLTVDPSAPQNGGAGADAYVPDITGIFNGQAITGLDTTGGYNNWLYFQNPGNASYTLTYPTQPLWQVYELAFLTSADEYVMNGDPVGGYETFDNNNGGSGAAGDDGYNLSGNPIGNTGSFSLMVAPEPSMNGLFFEFVCLFIGWRSWRSVRTARASNRF